MTQDRFYDLERWGLSEETREEASRYGEGVVARVMEEQRGLYRLVTEAGGMSARVSGKFRFQSLRPSDFPAVGDWVVVSEASGVGVIHHRLQRTSSFVRKAPGRREESQVVAANIDGVHICMAMSEDFNLRRLERYLAVAWDSGAAPAVILTKKDLCDNPEEMTRQVEQVALGVEVRALSVKTGEGFEALEAAIEPGRTVAFIGSSGVGKSSLINRLRDSHELRTRNLRKIGKGKHTTTHRQLFMLDGGGMVVDTPGMRELGVEGADFDHSFRDIETLKDKCRFADCSHTTEAGCAVREALDSGELDRERYENYLKLQREADYARMNSREIEEEKIKRMFGGKEAMKQRQKAIRDKNRR